MNKMQMHYHLEKVVYLILGGLIAITFIIIKERIFDVPDYRITAKIQAPLLDVKGWLVEEKTGKTIELPNFQGGINPIEVLLKNTGKKPIENIEVILEFLATGDFSLSDEEFAVKPDKGFGKVEFKKPNNMERRVKLSLFNPGDEFMYFATGSRPVKVITYSRFPGLTFHQEYWVGKYYTPIRLSIFILISLFIVYGLFLSSLVQKRIIKQYGIMNIPKRGFLNVYWNDRHKTEREIFFYGLTISILSSIFLAIYW